MRGFCALAIASIASVAMASEVDIAEFSVQPKTLGGSVGTGNSTIIYDTLTGQTGISTTGGLPRNRMADGGETLAPGAGQTWEVDTIEVALFVAAAGTWNVDFDVVVWDGWNSAGFGGAGTNVFQDQVDARTFSLAPFTTTGVSAFLLTLDYSANPFQIGSLSDLDFGLEVQWRNNGLKTDSLASGIRDAAPTVGTSSNLFYRDADNDEVIETTDGRTITGWTNANFIARITAREVPEPASMLLLAIGGLLTFRRR